MPQPQQQAQLAPQHVETIDRVLSLIALAPELAAILAAYLKHKTSQT